MKESSMPQLVLAVATKKLMKTMLKEEGGEDGEATLHPIDVAHQIVGMVWNTKENRVRNTGVFTAPELLGAKIELKLLATGLVRFRTRHTCMDHRYFSSTH